MKKDASIKYTYVIKIDISLKAFDVAVTVVVVVV